MSTFKRPRVQSIRALLKGLELEDSRNYDFLHEQKPNFVDAASTVLAELGVERVTICEGHDEEGVMYRLEYTQGGSFSKTIGDQTWPATEKVACVIAGRSGLETLLRQTAVEILRQLDDEVDRLLGKSASLSRSLELAKAPKLKRLSREHAQICNRTVMFDQLRGNLCQASGLDMPKGSAPHPRDTANEVTGAVAARLKIIEENG